MKRDMNKFQREAIKINHSYYKDRIQIYKSHSKGESRAVIK